MSLKNVFVGCMTALLGVVGTGCATSPQEQKTSAKVANPLPDYTVTNPETGCRYIPDKQNPDAPRPCMINEFPSRFVK